MARRQVRTPDVERPAPTRTDFNLDWRVRCKTRRSPSPSLHVDVTSSWQTIPCSLRRVSEFGGLRAGRSPKSLGLLGSYRSHSLATSRGLYSGLLNRCRTSLSSCQESVGGLHLASGGRDHLSVKGTTWTAASGTALKNLPNVDPRTRRAHYVRADRPKITCD